VQGSSRVAGDHGRSRAGPIFHSPYFGAKGWIGLGLDEGADWRKIEAFIRRSYRLVAPKRFAKLVA
jgi:predicted DNA-binding protein (MmcQ/YjbR family)